MITKSEDLKKLHTGVIHTLMQEYETHRLPRLLKLKDKLDRGEVINDVEFLYLCKEIHDANLAVHLTVNYPELQEFCLQMSHLYREICDEAMENESR